MVTPARLLRSSRLCLLLLAVPAGLFGQDATCQVERVIDGDTLVCEGGERLRLLLMDTPELGDEPFGQAARGRLLELAEPGTELTLKFDVGRRDRYERLLAYAYLPDGRMVNLEMVRAGYAVPMVVPPNVRHVEIIRSTAAEAREARRGLWSTDVWRPVEPGPRPLRADDCDPSYPDVCIPSPPPDLDCADISHRWFRVEGRDPHSFDTDRDGIGCESGRSVSTRGPLAELATVPPPASAGS